MSAEWYMTAHNAQPRGRVRIGHQIEEAIRDRAAFTLPEGILRLAQAEYEHQFGHAQDYERMQERGGLSTTEVIGLLADYAERLGAKPTTPPAKDGTP